MPDVFISYAREDKSFVERLVQALKDNGRDVWVDFEDIPYATDWWNEIQTGIESSTAVIYVISPDSLASRYCGLELSYAMSNHKRLIPVLYRELGQVQPQPQVAALNWIFFKDQARFDQSMRELLTTIANDYEDLRQQTRLLMLARDWERKGHNRSFLLRGAELTELENLGDDPDLTELQRTFLLESLQQQRRLDIYRRFALGFVGGFLGVGFWAFSTFVSDQLLTPLRFIYTSSLGQVFGLFIGMLAVLAGELPLRVQALFSKPVLMALRILASLAIGIAAWAVFRWLYLQEGSTLNTQNLNTVVFSGIGLALPFIVRALIKLPGWAAVTLTAISIYIPMYVTHQNYWSRGGLFDPLIFFADNSQVFSIGIPMVVLIAIGANAQALSLELRGMVLKMRTQR